MPRGLALALVLVAATACGGPRSSLGTPATLCYRALPAAAATVHHKGRFVGVRRMKSSAVVRYLPQAAGAADLCVVAYSDHFKPGDVEGVHFEHPARYAIVAVTARTLKPAGAFVTNRLPFRFQRRV